MSLRLIIDLFFYSLSLLNVKDLKQIEHLTMQNQTDSNVSVVWR